MEIVEQSRIESKIVQISRGSKMGENTSLTLSLEFPQLLKLETLESYLTITCYSLSTIRQRHTYYAFYIFLKSCPPLYP